MHSIAQELTMIKDMSLEEAEELVSDMKERVQMETQYAEDVLQDEGLSICTAWINELKNDDY